MGRAGQAVRWLGVLAAALALAPAAAYAVWAGSGGGVVRAAGLVLQPPTGFTATAGCTPTSATTIAFRAASSATGGSTVTVGRPAGTVAGDLLLALWTQRREGVTVTAPAGWTLLHRTDSAAGTLLSTASYYYRATAGDPVSWTWSSSSGDLAAVVVAGYSGVSAGAVPASAAQIASGTATVTAPSVNAARANSRLVALFGVRGTGGISPQAGLTERDDVSTAGSPTSNNVNAAIADAPLAEPGATGSRTATAAAAGQNAGHLVALRPQSFPQTTLSWTPTTSTYATGYTWQRLAAGTVQTTANITPAATGTVIDNPPAAGTAYDYRISSFAQGWRSTAAVTSTTTSTTC